MVKKKRKPRSQAARKHEVTMSPELREVLLKQREAFIRKVGKVGEGPTIDEELAVYKRCPSSAGKYTVYIGQFHSERGIETEAKRIVNYEADDTHPYEA